MAHYLYILQIQHVKQYLLTYRHIHVNDHPNPAPEMPFPLILNLDLWSLLNLWLLSCLRGLNLGKANAFILVMIQHHALILRTRLQTTKQMTNYQHQLNTTYIHRCLSSFIFHGLRQMGLNRVLMIITVTINQG